MNTPKDPITSEDRPQVNEQRRRLAKGGLAAPIVVGTMMSRPVLGAAPHNCTVSGQLSGNISTHVQGTCNTLGQSPDYWKTLATWPSTVTSLVTKTSEFTVTGFLDKYWYKASSDTLVQPGTTDAVIATFQQVLEEAGDSTPPTNLDLGRAAIASYLNAIQFAPNFPLSTAQVVAMFNATIDGGSYQINATTSWTATQVLAYFRSLYVYP